MSRTLVVATAVAMLSVTPKLGASDINSGAAIYRAHCAACHGPSGRSVMAGSPDLNRPASLMQSDQKLLRRIQSGKNACPAYRGILTEQKIFDVIAYIRTLAF